MQAKLTILGLWLLLTVCVLDSFRPNSYRPMRCSLHGQRNGCKISAVSHFNKQKIQYVDEI